MGKFEPFTHLYTFACSALFDSGASLDYFDSDAPEAALEGTPEDSGASGLDSWGKS